MEKEYRQDPLFLVMYFWERSGTLTSLVDEKKYSENY
jgi:hypothetical protein